MGIAGQPVQVLFRPEDVLLKPAGDGTSAGQLGQGQVEQNSFSGAFERVRLRLPAVTGLRPIAPRMSFGDNSFQVEATRSMEQARDWPLTPADKVWVGVQRIHTLAHPGFSFLILSDGTNAAKAAVNLGGQMARMAHAQVTLLRYGAPAGASDEALQTEKEALGSGLGGLELRATPDGLLLAAMLAGALLGRTLIHQAQIVARHPYAEIRDNLIDAGVRPVDLLRCKLSFFGAARFDPKSDRWVRITLFENAPFPDELHTAPADDWAFGLPAARCA